MILHSATQHGNHSPFGVVVSMLGASWSIMENMQQPCGFALITYPEAIWGQFCYIRIHAIITQQNVYINFFYVIAFSFGSHAQFSCSNLRLNPSWNFNYCAAMTIRLYMAISNEMWYNHNYTGSGKGPGVLCVRYNWKCIRILKHWNIGAFISRNRGGVGSWNFCLWKTGVGHARSIPWLLMVWRHKE